MDEAKRNLGGLTPAESMAAREMGRNFAGSAKSAASAGNGAPGERSGQNAISGEAGMGVRCPVCGGTRQMVFDADDLAGGAYVAYSLSTGNKNFRGEEMPGWYQLPEAIQTAWKEAVRFVFEKVA